MKSKPPLILDGAKVLEYAIVDGSVEYTGLGSIYVGGKLLGIVPKLTICQSYKAKDYLLFHCNETWKVLGIAGYASIREAKRSAEKTYKGITSKWKIIAKPNDFNNWPGNLEPVCSFCRKSFYEIDQMFEGHDAYICNMCVSKMQKSIKTDM
jgi:hypothetical protein